MRTILFTLLMLFYIDGISQILVQGTIEFLEGGPIPGADVIETGTDNRTRADINGNFALRTTKSPCTITFAFIGVESKTLAFDSDTTVTVILGYDYYNTRWASVGLNYDPINSVVGFQIGNGYDQEPLIHFEDFQDNVIFKIYGQSDFGSNYMYGGQIGWTYPPIRPVSRFAIEYTARNFESSGLFHTDLNLATHFGYFRNSLVLAKVGYQKLNQLNNFGVALGFEQHIKNFYLGLISGYYFDYFHHKVYLQAGFFAKGLISLRAAYDRIEKFDLLTVGINYTFVRNNNR